MITLTKLRGDIFHVNPHQIEYIESNPDTTLTMLSGKRLVVQEDVKKVMKLIISYRKEISSCTDGV